MVDYHRPPHPQPIVARRGRQSSSLARRPVCLWPGCTTPLASDHDDPVCGCHVSSGYRVAHDGDARHLVLHLLLAAYPEAVDLCSVLRCTSHELQAPLNWLRRRGHCIAGARRGYRYELPASGDRDVRGGVTVET